MSNSIKRFEEKLFGTNDQENIYYDIPIFKYIAAKDFSEAFLKLSNKDKRYLVLILDQRYNVSYEIIKKLKGEHRFFKDLYHILTIEKNNRPETVSGNFLEFDFLPKIEQFLKSLEKAQKD